NRIQSQMVSALRNLDDAQLGNATASDAIQAGLFQALSAAKILGDTNGDGLPTPTIADVKVTGVDLDAGNVTIEVRLTGSLDVASQNFGFGLGLPGVPLQIDTQGALAITAGFDYRNLKFGLSNNAFFLDTSAADELTASLKASV